MNNNLNAFPPSGPLSHVPSLGPAMPPLYGDPSLTQLLRGGDPFDALPLYEIPESVSMMDPIVAPPLSARNVPTAADNAALTQSKSTVPASKRSVVPRIVLGVVILLLGIGILLYCALDMESIRNKQTKSSLESDGTRKETKGSQSNTKKEQKQENRPARRSLEDGETSERESGTNQQPLDAILAPKEQERSRFPVEPSSAENEARSRDAATHEPAAVQVSNEEEIMEDEKEDDDEANDEDLAMISWRAHTGTPEAKPTPTPSSTPTPTPTPKELREQRVPVVGDPSPHSALLRMQAAGAIEAQTRAKTEDTSTSKKDDDKSAGIEEEVIPAKETQPRFTSQLHFTLEENETKMLEKRLYERLMQRRRSRSEKKE